MITARLAHITAGTRDVDSESAATPPVAGPAPTPEAAKPKSTKWRTTSSASDARARPQSDSPVARATPATRPA